MIDLHIHLDGSLPPQTIRKLADMHHVTLPSEEELSRRLTAPADCESLNQYLTCFDLPLTVLQWPDTVEQAVFDLIVTLHQQGLLYTEIRFAPQLSTRQGHSQEEILTAAIQGLDRAVTALHGETTAQLILCCMRGDGNEAENLETIRLAHKYLHRGVSAADLAGAEAVFPTACFQAVFAQAKRLAVPFTLHAGEADGPASIANAIAFGASRIGHGVRAREDANVLRILREKQIPLELCPVSNVQTKAVCSMQNHPVLEYLRKGLAVTVNTDNMTVSGTSLAQEYRLLKEHLGMTEAEHRKLLLNAADAAFLSEEDKLLLKEKVLQKLQSGDCAC